MYFTYVLYSSEFDRIYIGHTGDLNARIPRHNSGLVKSTRPFKPWRLIHSEEFATRSKAMRREKELKTHRGRDFIRTELLNR